MFILFKITPFITDENVLWCVDGLSDEERLAWQNKVVKVKNDYEYWLNDVKGCENNLKYLEENKHTMSQDSYLAQKAEDEACVKSRADDFNAVFLINLIHTHCEFKCIAKRCKVFPVVTALAFLEVE